MKLDDLGINPKTGFHDRRLTRMESRLVGILWIDHEGKANKISADALAIQYYTRSKISVEDFLKNHERKILEKWKRIIRDMQNHILFCHDGIPFHSKSGLDGGYYIAETKEEGEDFYTSFMTRGLTGIRKGARGRQASIVDAVQQLSFDFDEPTDLTGFTMPIRPRVATPTPIEVVDALLERMTRNPEKFADGLRKLREKHSSILLPKRQVAAMQAKAAELQAMVSSLGVSS